MTQEHDAETVERVAAAMAYAVKQPNDACTDADEYWHCTGLLGRETWKQAARAALSAMPPREVTGWQPIETAPKDGTILAVCMEDYTQLVIWDQEIDYGKEGVSQIWRSVLTDKFVIPIHWMPLPPAPEAK